MDILDYLKKLEDNGYEAYIVGGYVRDKLLNIESSDIDITTNAKPKEVSNIFDTKAKDNFVNLRKMILNILLKGDANLNDKKQNLRCITERNNKNYSKILNE